MLLNKNLTFVAQPQTSEEREQNIIGFTISANIIDRDFERFDLKTMDISPFASSGSLTLFHSWNKFPIGVPVRVTIDDEYIKAWVKFDLDELDDVNKTAETAYRKVLGGSLVNCSVEAAPTPDTIGEIIDEPVGNRPYYVVYKYLALTGFSLVITPANPMAQAINTNRQRCEVVDTRSKVPSFEEVEDALGSL